MFVDFYINVDIQVVSNIGFEMGGVFLNAYLPSIAPKDKIGRVSGYGWSLGYLGGLIALGIGYVFLVNPENPAFGFSNEMPLGEHICATNLMVALWFIIFSIGFFLFNCPYYYWHSNGSSFWINIKFIYA